MKSEFSSFVVAFCSVCVLLGGLYTVCPNGKFEKPVKYIFCLVFLCLILSATIKINPSDFKISDFKESDIDISESARVSVRLVFEEALRKENIEFKKITVCTDNLTDGSIVITKVIVYSRENSKKIEEIIGGKNGYTVEVFNE